MSQSSAGRCVFLTWVYTEGQKACARLLVESIRAFGGAMSDCPIWLFEANPQSVPCGDLESLGVQVIPLSLPETIGPYYFRHKVYACAQAEARAASGVRALVWLSPETLIVKPPLLFDLAGSFDAAVRPVHIQNVGLPSAQPLDGFWKGVYEAVGARDIETTVESFVDLQTLRAYFNSAAFAINPATGLFARWFESFQALVNDRAYQSSSCQDEWHQVFLHQALLSSLIVTTLAPERIHLLPPDYGYPYNLHPSVPSERRAQALDDLVCVIYEERSLDPQQVDDIEINEPLRSWLAARVGAHPSREG